MIARLRAALKAARERLWRLIHARHDSPARSERRKKLAEAVRVARQRKGEIAAKLTAAIKARTKPDWNGHAPVLGSVGAELVLAATAHGLVVTATTDGTHATNSYHYQRRAIDFGVIGSLVGTQEAWNRLVAFQRWVAERHPGAAELFGPQNDCCIKNGQRITIGEGTDLEQAHDNHDHVAI